MARPREHGEARRAQLLDAAAHRLHQEGPDSLSLRRLAEDAGTTTRAIYTLFGSKKGLLRALYRRGFEILHQRQSMVQISGDPEVDLVALAHAYRSTALENRELYGLMFDRLRGYEPAAEDREFARRTLIQVRDAVRAGVAAGRLPDDSRAITLQLWGLVHGLATLELQGVFADADTWARYWSQAVTAFVRGYALSPRGRGTASHERPDDAA